MDKKLIVPDHWTQISLVDDFKYIKTGVESYEGAKKYYSTGSIKKEEFTPEGEYTFHERPSRANRLVKKGDILQARMQGTNKALLIDQELDKQLFSTGFFQVHPFKDTYHSKLLYYYFSSSIFLNKKDSLCSGSTQSALNDAEAKKLFIPLPPILEQYRIVEKIETNLSELYNSIKSLNAAKVQLKYYRQSVLKSAFEGKLTEAWRETHANKLESAESLLKRIKTERETAYEKKLDEWQKTVTTWEVNGKEGKKPAKPRNIIELPLSKKNRLTILPDSWMLTNISHIAKVETGATPLKSNNSYYANGNIPWVTSGALNNWKITETSDYITELALDETNVKLFPKKTLLVAMYGEGKTRGKCSELMFEATTNQAVAALVQDGIEEQTRYYLKWYMQRNYEDIRLLASGGAQPNLNLDIVKNTLIPLAPLDEQHQIVNEIESRLSQADAMENVIDDSLKKAELLRQSILKKAFEGKLVVQNANDEPVSKLLKSIKEEKEKYQKEQKAQKRKVRPKVEQKEMEILEVLEKSGSWVKAQNLFEQYTDEKDTDTIEGFYQKLRELINNGDIEVKREAEVDWFRTVKK